MTTDQRWEPRDAEEAAALKGMGQAITVIRERRGMARERLAAKCEMTPAELEKVERGNLDESWGGVRLIAKALDIPLGALMIEAEEFAPGPGGEKWRHNTGEAEGDSTVPGPRSDAAEGGSRIGTEIGAEVTEGHERWLWEELNLLLADAVPDGANENQAEDATLLAVMGHDSEIHDLYEQVRKIARDQAGYLRERLEEDNPISRIRRRLYGRWG